MNDDDKNRLEAIAKDIGNMASVPAALPRRDLPWPGTPRNIVRAVEERPNGSHGENGNGNGDAYTPKNEDVPRAGELSSKVFNDLTTRIISELQETVESQINDAINRRSHALAQMESLKAEIDKAFKEYEESAKHHQKKVNALAEAVKKKVESDTREMIALSQRLRKFADSVNVAHEQFFKE